MTKKSVEKEVKEQTTETASTDDRKFFKLDDSLIGIIRELVQLSLLTGTNIVDHLRAVIIEATPDNKIAITPEYVEAYNNMILKLNAEAEQKMQDMQNTLATDEEQSPETVN